MHFQRNSGTALDFAELSAEQKAEHTTEQRNIKQIVSICI